MGGRALLEAQGPSWECGTGDGPGMGGIRGFGVGRGCLSFAWDLHSGPCSSTKVHEVISDGGQLLPLPPAVLPLCAAHAACVWGMHRVSPPCTPAPLGGAWEKGRGCRSQPQRGRGSPGSSAHL